MRVSRFRETSIALLPRLRGSFLMGVGLVMSSGIATAGPADVISARAKCSDKSVCTFEVTVKHADEGWRHYADRWEVVGPKGKVLATRALQHPHVGEQPFTRTLAGVAIPASVMQVTIRAHDSVHGSGGAETSIELTR